MVFHMFYGSHNNYPILPIYPDMVTLPVLAVEELNIIALFQDHNNLA